MRQTEKVDPSLDHLHTAARGIEDVLSSPVADNGRLQHRLLTAFDYAASRLIDHTATLERRHETLKDRIAHSHYLRRELRQSFVGMERLLIQVEMLRSVLREPRSVEGDERAAVLTQVHTFLKQLQHQRQLEANLFFDLVQLDAQSPWADERLSA